MKNIELLHQAIQTEDKTEATRLIKRFILSNDLQTNTKFNMFDYVSNDKYRLALMGVCYVNGCQYATDAHLMVKITQPYNPDFEGKIIDKKGEIIKEIFPRCDSVIPLDTNLNFVPIDWGKVLQAEKQYKLDKKTDKELNCGIIKIGESYFSVVLLAKIAKFAKYANITEMGVNEGFRAAKIGKGTDNIAILMPMEIETDNEAANKQRKEYFL